jgi:hypothetical protein
MLQRVRGILKWQRRSRICWLTLSCLLKRISVIAIEVTATKGITAVKDLEWAYILFFCILLILQGRLCLVLIEGGDPERVTMTNLVLSASIEKWN